MSLVEIVRLWGWRNGNQVRLKAKKKSNWDTARAIIDSSLIKKQKENKKEVAQQKPVQQKTTVATIKKDTIANISVNKGKQKADTISAAEMQRRRGNYKTSS